MSAQTKWVAGAQVGTERGAAREPSKDKWAERYQDPAYHIQQERELAEGIAWCKQRMPLLSDPDFVAFAREIAGRYNIAFRGVGLNIGFTLNTELIAYDLSETLWRRPE